MLATKPSLSFVAPVDSAKSDERDCFCFTLHIYIWCKRKVHVYQSCDFILKFFRHEAEQIIFAFILIHIIAVFLISFLEPQILIGCYCLPSDPVFAGVWSNIIRLDLLMYQELLRDIGQGHIADAYLYAEEEQRKQLEAQIAKIEAAYPGGLRTYYQNGIRLLKESA